MLDHLRAHTEEAGRDPASIDVAFTTGAARARRATATPPPPTSTGSRPWPRSGVTWNSVGMPGDSLDHAVEALEQYGAEVISQYRGRCRTRHQMRRSCAPVRRRRSCASRSCGVTVRVPPGR